MSKNDIKPLKYGVVLFPGFQLSDVAGPIDVLNVLSSHISGISLAIIAATLDPVSTQPDRWPNPFMAPFTTAQLLVPTHTFQTAPLDLDVLLIPGGMGSFDASDMTKPNLTLIAPILIFILARYPTLEYLLTVCTGSGITSLTGLLDGKRATMFKGAWPIITKWRKEVKWVSRARWTEDGNIWTSSGVCAGTDMFYAFVGKVYGDEVAASVAGEMEYVRHMDPDVDPYGIDV